MKKQIKILVLDGIGTEGRTSNVIDDVVRQLVSDLSRHQIIATAKWINYPAAMLGGVGGSETWEESSESAIASLVVWFAENPDTDVVILSYSGGNKPSHEFLEMFPQFHDRIKAVGFMSDPWRPRDKWQHDTPNPGGFGICGEKYGPISDRSFWTSAYGDPISGASENSLLRYAADLSRGHPRTIIHDAITHFHEKNGKRFQLAKFLGLPVHEWFFGLGARIRQAGIEANRYLTGYHTTHYTRPFRTSESDNRSLAVRFGSTIAWAVKARM